MDIVDSDEIKFTDKEFLHFAWVRAKDEQFRCEMFENIKKLEDLVNRLTHRKAAVLDAAHQQSKICVLCCTPFTWLHRPVKCHLCSYLECKSCITLNQMKKSICILCSNTRELEKQRRRWNILFPYSMNCFVASKLSIPPPIPISSDFDSDEEINEEILHAYFTRNMVELKVNEMCHINVDESPTDKEAADMTLRELTICLETCIKEFISKCQCVNDSDLYFNLFQKVYGDQIFDLCREIRASIQHIEQTGRKAVLNSRDVNETRTYENLLSVAIVNQLIMNISWISAESSANVGIQTDVEYSASISGRTDSLIGADFSFFDIDSALGADDQSSINSGFQSNGKEYGQPSTVRSLKHFIVTLPLEGDEESFNDKISIIPDHSQENCSKSNNQQEENPIFVIEPKHITCQSGEKIVFECKFNECASHLDYTATWYRDSLRIEDEGRYRLVYLQQHRLEIFDLTPIDSGEIVCKLIFSHSGEIYSQTCTVEVEDCDVAGEDPYFDKLLENQVAAHGATVTLQVHALGYPEPRVVFYHNRSIIKDDDRRSVENRFGIWTLKIQKALALDAGEYTAYATNRMGRACSKANFHIIHANYVGGASAVYRTQQESLIRDGVFLVELISFSTTKG